MPKVVPRAAVGYIRQLKIKLMIIMDDELDKIKSELTKFEKFKKIAVI